MADTPGLCARSYNFEISQDKTLGDLRVVTLCALGNLEMTDRDRDDGVCYGTLNAYYIIVNLRIARYSNLK